MVSRTYRQISAYFLIVLLAYITSNLANHFYANNYIRTKAMQLFAKRSNRHIFSNLVSSLDYCFFFFLFFFLFFFFSFFFFWKIWAMDLVRAFFLVKVAFVNFVNKHDSDNFNTSSCLLPWSEE